MKKPSDDIESSEERIRSNRIYKELLMHTDATPHGISYDRPIQNYCLVWLDTNISVVNDADTIAKLRQVVNTVKKFTDADECVNFMCNVKDEKIFMICSGELCQTIIPLVHDMVQLYCVYIFGKNDVQHEQWAKNWFKVKGVHTDITSICEALKQAARNCDQNLISISFVEATDKISDLNLNTLDQSFMNTQLLKEALLTIDFEEEPIKDFLTYCREHNVSLKIIDLIEKEYHEHEAIYWYTYPCFLNSMLNNALRLMEIDRIIKMGFFIRHLHHKIVEQYGEQKYMNSFTVFRGQGLSRRDSTQLLKTKGGLMSFNNFLSTSLNRAVSFAFAESIKDNPNHNPDQIGVLFKITIDPSISSCPFANTRGLSYFPNEEEILFSMHSVFRIEKIDNGDDRLWQVNLTLTSDTDPQLQILTKSMQEEMQGPTGWFQLGKLMIRLGQFSKSEKLHTILLEHNTAKDRIAYLYHMLGVAKYRQGKHNEAIEFYKKAIEITEKNLPSNHSGLATSYNSISLVYNDMGDYSIALLYSEKALKIRKETLPTNHPDLATSYHNIGGVYMSMGEYSKALSYYETALDIRQKALPANHPDLVTSYNNIGSVYNAMGEYLKALLDLTKALDIRQKTLPPDHSDLAASYNNIGSVYDEMGEYSEALSYYEKAFKIYEKAHPANYPSLAASHSNIGSVYYSMGDYSKALPYYVKAIEIEEKALPANHPSLAISYNSIGMVYVNMGEYSKALSYSEKALEIRQKALPENHPDLATSYNNIGFVYDKLREYSKALSYYEKALEIKQKTLPPDHPALAASHNNIGTLYAKIGEFSKALPYLEKALEIVQKTLPANHPDLATSHNNIGSAYDSMDKSSEALSNYKKALEIQQKTLPENHPDLATSYNNIGTVYAKMGEYPNAFLYFKRAFNIFEHSLPPTHPTFQTTKKNIEIVITNLLMVALLFVPQRKF